MLSRKIALEHVSRIEYQINSDLEKVQNIVRLHLQEDPEKLTLLQIAKVVLDVDDVLKYPNVYQRAISRVLTKELWVAHMRQVSLYWRQKIMKTLRERTDFNTVICSSWGKWRHKKWPKMDVELLLSSQWKKLFTELEVQRILELLVHPWSQYSAWPHKGSPNIQKIADIINQEFHKWNSVRSKRSIEAIRYERNRKKQYGLE